MMSSGVNNSMNMSGDFIAQAPPNFPDAIRSVQTNYDETGTDFANGTSTILERTAPVMTEEIIQKREDTFFKEMLNSHKPTDGHPLTHLITAQSKLESLTIGAPDINIDTKKKNKKVRNPACFGRVDVAVLARCFSLTDQNPLLCDFLLPSSQSGSLAPYEQSQTLIEFDPKGKKKRAARRRKKKQGEEDKAVDVSLSASNVSAPALSASAARHRDFLMSTLHDIQDQLAAPTALKTLVEAQGIEDKRRAEEEEQGEGEEGVVEDDALPADAHGGDAVGLFKQSLKIGDRLCSVTSFASHAWEGGPYQITFIILYPTLGESWRIAVTEEDLNLDEEASLANMPLPKLKAQAKKVVEQLTWVGSEEGGDLGIVFLALS